MEEQFDSHELEAELLPWLIKGSCTWEGDSGREDCLISQTHGLGIVF